MIIKISNNINIDFLNANFFRNFIIVLFYIIFTINIIHIYFNRNEKVAVSSAKSQSSNVQNDTLK